MNLRRIRAVAVKEFLHILRDPRSLYMALTTPLLLLLLFGYALTLDVDRIPALVYDQSQTPESRAMIARFQGSRFFDIRGFASGYAEIDRAIDRSEILAGIVIPPDFSRQLARGDEAPVQILLDGSDSNTASIALGYAEGLVQLHALELRSEVRKMRPPLEPRLRVLYNSELKSRNFIVPGLIAVILMIIASMLTSLTIAREWESGTMEQLLSTPLRPTELLFGKLSAYFTLGMVDMIISVLVGTLLFRVPLEGNLLLLFATSSLFLFGGLCWGLFLSAITRNQLLAYQMGTLSSFLPAFLLSGFIFAIDNMPRVIQVISHIVPARYFVTILKGIFLKGIGVQLLWVEILFLLAYAVIVFSLATRKLRQKMA
jgi:ABC-2 type transport system permease protein